MKSSNGPVYFLLDTTGFPQKAGSVTGGLVTSNFDGKQAVLIYSTQNNAVEAAHLFGKNLGRNIFEKTTGTFEEFIDNLKKAKSNGARFVAFDFIPPKEICPGQALCVLQNIDEYIKNLQKTAKNIKKKE